MGFNSGFKGLKRSFSVSRKIRFRTPNVAGFPSRKNVCFLNCNCILKRCSRLYLYTYKCNYMFRGVEIAQSVWRLATGWTVRGSNPGGGEIFCTRPGRPWGPTSFLYNGYRVFPGVKRRGRGVDHPPPTCAEVEGRVELCICSPSGTSWPVLR